jgi:hypothetical protein
MLPERWTAIGCPVAAEFKATPNAADDASASASASFIVLVVVSR